MRAALTARIEKLSSELSATKAELKGTKAELDEEMKKVLKLSREVEKLKQQLRDLARRYRMAEAALVHMSKELGTVTLSLERAQQAKAEAEKQAELACSDAEARVAQVVKASRAEREMLAKSALQTVHQMQQYVSSTLGWLGSLHAAPDASPLPAKSRHRWGFTAPGGDPAAASSLSHSRAKSSLSARAADSSARELPPVPYTARPPIHVANSTNPLAGSRGQAHRAVMSMPEAVAPPGARAPQVWPRPASSFDTGQLQPVPPGSGHGIRSFSDALEQGERDRAALTDGAIALARACLKEAVAIEASDARGSAASPRRKRLATV